MSIIVITENADLISLRKLLNVSKQSIMIGITDYFVIEFNQGFGDLEIE